MRRAARLARVASRNQHEKMRRARSCRFAALTLAAVALILGYFLLSLPAQPTYSGPPEKVTIAYSATTDAVLAEVAQMQGLYLQEGLEATAHLHRYGKPGLQSVPVICAECRRTLCGITGPDLLWPRRIGFLFPLSASRGPRAVKASELVWQRWSGSYGNMAGRYVPKANRNGGRPFTSPCGQHRSELAVNSSCASPGFLLI